MAPFNPRLFIKRYWYPLAAGALIACGVAARLALTLIGWPHANSEEGTMGLEAMHILLRGEHPIYLYGQNYMGVGEAYAGALAFRIFGISVASLRLGMIAFYALFMVGVFWLADLLYSRRVALASLAVLVLGTPFLGQIELRADGGKAETMAFGALMFALASWLALTPPAEQPWRGRRAPRCAAYAAWGLLAGLGLYTYTVIAPFVLTSGLLIGLACWRERRGWAWALPVVGLLIGLLPDIIHTARTPYADNPIAVFLSLHQSLNAGGPSSSSLLPKQVVGTLLYTLPAVTGLTQLYPVEALPLYGPRSGATWTAVIIGGGWSLAYLVLLGLATYHSLRALRQRWPLRRTDMHPASGAPAGGTTPSAAMSPLAARDGARGAARLLLALTAWLTIAAYMFSATAANNPHSGRYMIGLLVITPAILWPLLDRAPRLQGAKTGPAARPWDAIAGGTVKVAGVALVCVGLALGVIRVAQDVPEAVAANGRDARLAHDLLSHGVTRFYSEYWTCDLLMFETRERLICAVVNDYAQPGLTRYHPYYLAVRADKNAPYVLSRGSTYERTFLIHAAQTHQTYSLERIDGRDVYFPTPT
ncbi:MAG TPA: hypothetical protein VFQ25_00835 [Ktedonobacterales bacterium]|nr:hypothetical protein [Ktedonobacterales bacterium]